MWLNKKIPSLPFEHLKVPLRGTCPKLIPYNEYRHQIGWLRHKCLVPGKGRFHPPDSSSTEDFLQSRDQQATAKGGVWPAGHFALTPKLRMVLYFWWLKINDIGGVWTSYAIHSVVHSSVIEFSWHLGTPICLHVVSGCFPTIAGEGNS